LAATVLRASTATGAAAEAVQSPPPAATAPRVLRKPPLDELQRIATSYGLDLSREDLASFRGLMDGVLASYRRLDQFAEPTLPVKYPREPGWRPAAAENKLNAWYWKCSIKGASSGPLSGKKIAIKDNVCVAGVPMMNGSNVLEGYVPEGDATIVTRILDAGGEIVGKGGLRAPLLLGRQPHLRHWARPQPARPQALRRRLVERQRGAGRGRRVRHGDRR
jgi:amidase